MDPAACWSSCDMVGPPSLRVQLLGIPVPSALLHDILRIGGRAGYVMKEGRCTRHCRSLWTWKPGGAKEIGCPCDGDGGEGKRSADDRTADDTAVAVDEGDGGASAGRSELRDDDCTMMDKIKNTDC